MRVVSWNCSQSLSRKLDLLLALEPDVAVVQECERDLSFPSGYCYTWKGSNLRKGLGVLTRDRTVSSEPTAPAEWTHFLPVTLWGATSELRLLGVWAYNHRAKRLGSQRVGDPLSVVQELSSWLRGGPSIVAGDFNNSAIWDRPEIPASFGAINAYLNDLGLTSAYHTSTKERFGHESLPTFFHTKRRERSYHIDYCFIHHTLALEAVRLPNYEEWHQHSDHVPVIVDLRE